jgi:nitrate reductase assembly molybdenum cofactor insertion protein NarJ
MFMDGLRELYQAYGFAAVREWPDHLGVMLQFLAEGKDEEEIDEMISLYVVPSLRRMLEGFEDRETPYEEVLQALLLVLQGRPTRRNEKIVPETQEGYYLGK